MKKVLTVLAITSFAACGGGSGSATVDSVAKVATDSVKSLADSAKSTIDSTKNAAVDSIKSKVDAKIDSLKK